ncbi:Structure-specific endonuclease subunit slx4 [Frankliniella fusca]|uniref:Structure-specific endonuclease subunit slx4 n=1 Tax=Frankliniella fusca TaxID=407009 RepID=A0AAE1HCQ7_9NEOP|nr:Structure-specific endonuclease subunit slx4 [Frankliniella fusca]
MADNADTSQIKSQGTPERGASLSDNNGQQLLTAPQQLTASEKEIKFHEANPLWKELMRSMNCCIDHHLLRIMDITGYKTYQALKEMTMEDIEFMENFVKGSGILSRVDSKDLHMYLGPVKDIEKFCFLRGEIKLLLQIASYVKENHKETKKTLGNVSLFPIFKRNRNESRMSEEPSTKKKKSVELVVSSDVSKEIAKIKKLVKDHCVNKDYPAEIIKAVSHMTVEVKTVELQADSEGQHEATMSAKLLCSFCKKYQSCCYDKKGYWSTSNVNRHIKQHFEREDYKNCSIMDFISSSRQSSEADVEIEKNSSDNMAVDNDSISVNVENTTNPLSEMGDNQLNNQIQNEEHSDETERTITVNNSSGSGTIPWQLFCLTTMHKGFLNGGRCDQQHKHISPDINASESNVWNTRSSRRKRALGKHIEGQSRITAFFPILDQIETLLQSNKEMISELMTRVQDLTDIVSKGPLEGLKLPVLLKWMLDCALKNSKRNSPDDEHGNRFNLDMKYFCSYLYIIGGPFVYDFLHRNLVKSILSAKHVERVLLDISKPVVEGHFRFQELKEFLIKNDLPLKVWVSEDGTRIVQKFLYDVASNQIIGPVLPLTDDGIPITNSFPATSAAMIVHHFEKAIPASIGYAIMVQPIRDGSPAFCLTLFGSDNKFDSEHVFKRWMYIFQELAKLSIEVVGYSADGDGKLLCAMVSLMFKNCSPPDISWKDWFYASSKEKFLVTQDPVHTVNKFRSRLSPVYLLPIGNFTVSQAHLRLVLQKPKSDHGLSPSDLDKDKMNFNSSVKICSIRVTDVLKSTPGANGTMEYLTVMRYVLEAFLNEKLCASERIYKIWYALFFLRFWKLWLLGQQRYTLENFVTRNLYMCIEILAHALILLVIKFRDEECPEDLLVHLFSSQPSESFFRYARSMTTTQQTVINFPMKDFLQKVRRIDILQHVSSVLGGKLEFPKDKRKSLVGLLTADKLSSQNLPSNENIHDLVVEARTDALETLRNLGVSPKISVTTIKSSILNCKIVDFDVENETASAPLVYDLVLDDDDIPLDILRAFPSPQTVEDLNVSRTSEENPFVPPTSSYVYLPKGPNDFVLVKKSTFCWMLSSEGVHLSSERIHRVREKIYTSFGGTLQQQAKKSLPPERKKEVEVGDWVLFKCNTFLVGQVLQFSYLSGSSKSQRAYTLLKAPVEPPAGNTKGVGVLCIWYTVNDLVLNPKKNSVHMYVDILKYVVTLPPPVICNGKMLLDANVAFYLNAT